jgi:hypothetical protein
LLVLQEEGLITEVVNPAGLGVELQKQRLVIVVEGVGFALVDSAETMKAGIDGETNVALGVCGAEPCAVKTDVDFLGEEGDIGGMVSMT